MQTVKSLAKEDTIRQRLEKINQNCDLLILRQTTQHVETGNQVLGLLSKLSVTPPKPQTPPSPAFTVPFRRDPDFIDHGRLLDQILDKCACPASRVALVGLGGVG